MQVRDDYEEPAYGMIDTLFSLAEAYLFMQLVELVVSLALRLCLPSSWHGTSYGLVHMKLASQQQQ
jgi:hypothetical protein